MRRLLWGYLDFCAETGIISFRLRHDAAAVRDDVNIFVFDINISHDIFHAVIFSDAHIVDNPGIQLRTGQQKNIGLADIFTGSIENIAGDRKGFTKALIKMALSQRCQPVKEIFGTGAFAAFSQHDECSAGFDGTNGIKETLGTLIEVQILWKAAAADKDNICLIFDRKTVTLLDILAAFPPCSIEVTAEKAAVSGGGVDNNIDAKTG